MIILSEVLGHGAARYCYLYPDDKNLCVKIELTPDANSYEIHVYNSVKTLIPGQIPCIYPDTIETDKGAGILCQVIRDEPDGKISPNFIEFKRSGDFNLVYSSLNRIIKRLIARDIFFYDFNKGNFVVQTLKDGSKKVWFIDVKSLNRTGYLGFLHLERIFAPLARVIMFRRIRGLYKDLGLKFPFENLCCKKFLSTFFITVK